jgi:hypothetical protein
MDMQIDAHSHESPPVMAWKRFVVLDPNNAADMILTSALVSNHVRLGTSRTLAAEEK